MTTPCPCGRTATNASPKTRVAKSQSLRFSDCCGLYLNDNAAVPAPDAESLMRSRYSAFVLGRRGYLLATWHASPRPAAPELATAPKSRCPQVRCPPPVPAHTAPREC